MGIYRRGNTFWVDITVGHQRVRCSAKTDNRKAATELHDKLKAELWRQVKLGDKPKRSFDEAALRWLREKSHKKSLLDDAQRIQFWRKHCAKMTIDQISRQWVADRLDALKTRFGEPATNGTKNRYLALLRSILRAAEREWEWIDRAPTFKSYVEPKRRIAYFTKEQAIDLIKALPVHWRPATVFALCTGLRRANVFGLRWEQVNVTQRVAWIYPDEAKAGKMITVPLNDEAMAIIEMQRGKHPHLVFEGLKEISTNTWRAALKRAELPGHLRWHDLRHTWASWHAMAGTPTSVLQELGGWASPEMVKKYAHLSPEYLAQHASKIRFTSQFGHNDDKNHSAARINDAKSLISLGWPTGLEPATAGITKK